MRLFPHRMPTGEDAEHQSPVEDYGFHIHINPHEKPRETFILLAIGFKYSEDTYCWECGKDLPDIDGAGNRKTVIFDTELEELLEGWSRTMSYVGCVACRKGADRWEKIAFFKSWDDGRYLLHDDDDDWDDGDY